MVYLLGGYIIDSRKFTDFVLKNVADVPPVEETGTPQIALCMVEFNNWARRTFGKGYLQHVMFYAHLEGSDCIMDPFIPTSHGEVDPSFIFQEKERDTVMKERFRMVQNNVLDVDNMSFVTIQNPYRKRRAL